MRASSLILAVTGLFCLKILGAFLEERPPNQEPLSPESTPPFKILESPLQLNLTTVRGSREHFSGQGVDNLEAYFDSLFVEIRVGYQNENNAGVVLDFLVDTGSDLTWVAKQGYTNLPNAQVPPPGKEITSTFPNANVPDHADIDPKIWTARYGEYGASGRTMMINVNFADPNPKRAAIGLADQVSFKRRKATSEAGLLGMNIASTIAGWPGTKGAYSPLWLQVLDGTRLPKLFAVRLVEGQPGRYTGKIEVGGQLTDPNNGGIAPTGREINIPIVPATGNQQSDWRVRAQFLARPQGGNSNQDVSISGPIEVVLDTGATYVEVPAAIANDYNTRLGGIQVPPPPGKLVDVPCNAAGHPNGPDLVLSFPGVVGLNKKIVIPARKLVDGPYQNGNCVSLVRAAGPQVNLVGMPYFVSVEKTIFNSGGTLNTPSITALGS